jgi:hypothetical protein
VKLALGRLALIFGIAAVLVALAGLLYVADTIRDGAAVLIEIGNHAHG